MLSISRHIESTPHYIGLIPAAGMANRIPGLPCSKEIYPISSMIEKRQEISGPKVACQYLLQSMNQACISNAYFIIRRGKWDIPGFLRNGANYGINLAYIVIDQSSSVPYTLDQAYPYIKDFNVALGFPDILFSPVNVFEKLIARQNATSADIVLGLIPTLNQDTADMVELDGDGNIVRIHVKPEISNLQFAWIVAVWNPKFTGFIHQYLISINNDESFQVEREIFMGDIIQAAIDYGLAKEVEIFADGYFIDIGTPQGLSAAINQFS